MVQINFDILRDGLIFLRTAYDTLRSFIGSILAETLFKAAPKTAELYSDAISFLISLTALYLILEFVAIGRRIIKIILILGWILLFVAIGLSTLTIGR
ncbi:MAG: hypothetical protein RMJ31_03815 [Nitrososphaerota archaeon]|nr:hypothetical protein [Nitrososphaerota archaeon]